MHFDKPKYVGVGPGLSLQGHGRARYGQHYRPYPRSCRRLSYSGVDAGADITNKPNLILMMMQLRARAWPWKPRTLKGILWHQGESDARTSKVPLYQDALTTLAENLRRDLDAPEIPFIVGGLGDYLAENHPKSLAITAILKTRHFIFPALVLSLRRA